MSEGVSRQRGSELGHEDEYENDVSMIDLVLPLAHSWKALLIGPLLVAALAIGVTFVIAPTFTARTTILPPQTQQGTASAALASLGALSSLGGVSTRAPADQYVSLLQSATIFDRVIDTFELIGVYDVKVRSDARRKLADKVRVSLGKKDGLIAIEVDDESPQRAAEMASRFIEELRVLSGSLALTEAQQRRVFFEEQVQEARAQLTQAEQELQASGFNAAALRTEPRAAAEAYARLKSEVTATEVRLETLRRTLTESAAEVRQEAATVSALRAQLRLLETTSVPPANPDPGYISKFRDFKYQEALLDLLLKQYELARIDESREGALIQVIDAAQVPDKRSSPKRALTAVVTWGLSLILIAAALIARSAWRSRASDRDHLAERNTSA
jgi:uncharacterized protein involved in exopolysaccharide biosynthesis